MKRNPSVAAPAAEMRGERRVTPFPHIKKKNTNEAHPSVPPQQYRIETTIWRAHPGAAMTRAGAICGFSIPGLPSTTYARK